jgi:hypothetical protein
MSQHQKRPTGFQVLIRMVVLTFVTMLGLILVACGTTPEASAPRVSQIPTLAGTASVIITADSTATDQLTPQTTNTVPPVATMLRTMIPGTQAPTRVYLSRTPELEPTLEPGDSKSAFDTRVAQNQSARWTALALTPSSTPGSPTVTFTPEPTATEIMGWMGPFCGGAGNSQETQYHSCWQLMVNGHTINVNAGRLGGVDPGQGVIQVRELGADRYYEIGTYLTPSRQGEVEIAAVDGTLVYLVQSKLPQPHGVDVTPIPNFVFVFDLATLQWVSP